MSNTLQEVQNVFVTLFGHPTNPTSLTTRYILEPALFFQLVNNMGMIFCMRTVLQNSANMLEKGDFSQILSGWLDEDLVNWKEVIRRHSMQTDN